MLQNPFYLFFTACGAFFLGLDTGGSLLRIPYRHSLWSFLGEECAPGQRRAIVRALLAGLPGDSGAMAWILTMAALCLGGAGALFWYLVFSLLWLHPLGALAGLWCYYQPGGGGRVELSALLEGYCAAKGPAQGRDWAVCSAGFRHWRCAACCLCCSGYWPVLPPRREARGSCPGWWFCWPCGCSAGLWGSGARRCSSLLFLLLAGGGPARQSAQPDPRRQAGAAGCL